MNLMITNSEKLTTFIKLNFNLVNIKKIISNIFIFEEQYRSFKIL